MKKLTKNDLEKFQHAIMKDYGLKLEGDELYQAAFNLLKFVEKLIIFDKENQEKKEKVLKSS